jgi:hypothetical protein
MASANSKFAEEAPDSAARRRVASRTSGEGQRLEGERAGKRDAAHHVA